MHGSEVVLGLLGVFAVVAPVIPDAQRDALADVGQPLAREHLPLRLFGHVVPRGGVTPLAGENRDRLAFGFVLFDQSAELAIVTRDRFRAAGTIGVNRDGVEVFEHSAFETGLEKWEVYPAARGA